MLNEHKDQRTGDDKPADADMKQQAINLLCPRRENWRVPVLTASALHQQGINTIWHHMVKLKKRLQKDEQWNKMRCRQSCQWLSEEIRETLYDTIVENPKLKHRLAQLQQVVSQGDLPASVAANQLLSDFLNN